LVQKRIDNPSRTRNIKRELIEEPKPIDSGNLEGKWFWLSETDWVAYPPHISQAIEDAFINKTETKVKVDDDHFVDLTDQIQKRYDDEK